MTAAIWARGDAALLLEEPYGGFGQVNPTGHAAVYLPRVCAVTPLVLRRCAPDESGVVISRYYKVAGYDWVAIPLTAYLYAIDNPADIPDRADVKLVNDLRDNYRRRYLEALAPDRANGATPGGEWPQLVGVAFDRKIYGFQIETTEEQDDELIQFLNQRPNKRIRRNLATFLVSRNCADFARSILDFYYPHSVRRNLIADLGITTPKQVAKSLVKYAHRHTELEFTSFVIPQVPGSRRHSHPVDSVTEAVVRSKKYLVPLAYLHPFIAGSVVALYFGETHFNPAREAARYPASPQIAALLETRQKASADFAPGLP
ncbi:MAG TPA: hypothetical protein VKW06_06050 [Candidatus Angelobacter sp.]|nr:hypothetical protein [Candidatus Angelobacter sp.]